MRGASGTVGIMAGVISVPDTLVLGVGGTLGEAWMRGLLSGTGLDFGACEYFLGTSAGSIVAATLASGRRLQAGDRAARAWGAAAANEERQGLLRSALRVGSVAASPLAPLALATLTPAGRLARSAALAATPRPTRRLDGVRRHLDSLGATFDGRLRIAAVDRGSGGRVIFGAPGTPRAAVRDAVLASCAVPWLFAPVKIDGLAPTAAAGALRAITAAALVAEEMALRARGMRVQVIRPDEASAAAMGANLMNAGRVEEVLDAAFAQGRALTASA
jgi:NTE family protein